MIDESTFTDENGRELSFEEMMSEASREQANRLADDSEWSEKITIHIHSIINAFILGVNMSYPYYWEYQLPPNFDLVINKMSNLLHKEFKEQIETTLECVQISLLKLKGVYRRLAMSIPEYVEWNDIGNPEGNRFTSSMDMGKIDTEPSFIDLDVPPHNAVIYLRNCERDNKRFEEEFKKKYNNDADD